MKDYLKKGLDLNKIEYNKEQIDLLMKYMKIILMENEKLNLTAITDEKEFIEKHLIDCALAVKYIDSGKVLDIGSGAGLPGIVIKILNEKCDVLLLDALNKRVKVLEKVIKELGLTQISAIHGRAEELSKDKVYRENFDFVTSRAVAKFDMLLELSIPFLKVGGKFIALKGSKGEEEVSNSKKALDELNSSVSSIEKMTLPFSNSNRNIIITTKNAPTKKQYPRSFKKIKKGF